jgi:hypothetical protein
MSSGAILFLCLCALPFVLALVSYLGKLWMVGLNQQHELKLARLQVLAESLRQPQLDEQVRKQVAELLAEEHRLAGSWRRSGGWLGVLQALALGTGWFLMVVGGGYCALAWSTGLPFGLRDPAILAAMTGLAMVTLPTALREMLGRRLATASAAR